jgi:hypothetical protein
VLGDVASCRPDRARVIGLTRATSLAARAQDLYVGCKITVFKRMFELLDADEYTYT